MIQILTYTGTETNFQGKDSVVNSIRSPRSLDEFEINIISLADEKMWVNYGIERNNLNDIEDLCSLSKMIANSHKTKIIILMPQNIMYRYGYDSHLKKYMSHCELKNMLEPMTDRILRRLYMRCGNISLCYENTYTKVGDEYIDAAFYFEDAPDILLTANKSDKLTAISCGSVILSTLNLHNYIQIVNFLREINLIQDKQEIPEWMGEIKMFDDVQQFKVIEENNQAIKAANDNISEAMEKINKNNEYKSILYTNGEELVKVVFEILERMLGCDLSQFEDKKNEDFLFEKGGCVFIGEIKGVNHNVKSENVSQLDVHYQGYLEENEDKDQNSVKALLIMNHQKNKALDVREPVHEKQVNLAKRNGSLIVETITLLKLFEKYLTGSMSQEECLELLSENVGLLKI